MTDLEKELLEELEEYIHAVHAYLKTGENVCEQLFELWTAEDKARAAIAKAKGQS